MCSEQVGRVGVGGGVRRGVKSVEGGGGVLKDVLKGVSCHRSCVLLVLACI